MIAHFSVRRLAGDGARLTRQLKNMQAGIGAIDYVNVTALVGFHIVGLNRDLAAVLSVDLDAALIGRFGHTRNEEPHLFRMIGIAYIDRSHPGIKEADKGELSVEHRRHALVRGVGAETAAAV